MKKILNILLIGILVISLTGCGNSKKLKTYNLGDTVSTDTIEFTLNDSQLTIALSSTINENFGVPVDDYKDIGYGRFIEYEGNTSEMTFTASNWQIKKSLSEIKIEKGKWGRDESVNRIISAGEKGIFRAYGKIDGELNELKGTYYYSIELPNSKGEMEKFTYAININS